MRDPVHHLAALLPRDGAAVLHGHVLALLLLNISGLHHGLILAHLVGNLATFLTRLLNIVASLKGAETKGFYLTLKGSTCLGTWLQTWLLVVEHWRSVTKLVLVLGTREQIWRGTL